jgi:hypothetical protein
MTGFKFNVPPGWPEPPTGWTPPEGWTPDPSWPPAPAGWSFWVPDDDPAVAQQPAAAAAPEPTASEPPANSAPAPTPDEQVESSSGESEQAEAERVELEQIRAEIAAETERLAALREQVTELQRDAERFSQETAIEEVARIKSQLVELNDALLLQQVGIYEYHHPLENADAYRERLADLRERIKDTVRQRKAILASDRFSYNNSLAQGRKMTADFSKLMLRAYNAEADNCVRSLRVGTVETALKRLEASVETIARLGSMMEMRVAPEYHDLRVEEIELTADYLFKVQEERELAREERERLREERKAQQELAAERERLEKERTHYENALKALVAQGKGAEAAEIQARLGKIAEAIEMNDYRIANIRAGYVYVISNIGAFGENVVKIGMTRRLEPLERIHELGDASVPFPFDVHALYFSDDAVTLESELHDAFSTRRLNHVNLRREFFFATPHEVREVLASKVGNLLEFNESPEASQYFQSHGLWPKAETAATAAVAVATSMATT